MAFKFKWKMVLPLFVAAIFISSVLVVFSTGNFGEKQSFAYITIDFNTPNEVYNGKVPITEESTVLNIIASYAPTVEFEQGRVKCIVDFCNNNYSEWKMYKVDQDGVVDVEIEIESVNNLVNADEKFVFRYEEI